MAEPELTSTERAVSPATRVFVAVLVVAFPLLMFWARGGWFSFDDWDLLSLRTVGSAHDLFLPHGDHWSTLPVLLYRGLWWTFGIRTYTPYVVFVVTFHLAAAALLRVVMRRAGVGPWVSTIFAGAFVFFGRAADTVLVAFFMTLISSLVFGLVQLLLADHDGPFDRRDWLGLAAGLAGMLCSGIAVTMVIVVGIASLLRRGWRVALMHTVPLGAIYLVWLAIIGTEGNRLPLKAPTIGEMARFVAVGVRATTQGIGRLPAAGLLVAVVLIVGLVVAGAEQGRAFATRSAGALALLAGALIFLGIAATGRAGAGTFGVGNSPESARFSRYVYLAVAMMLPALALAADALLRRWRAVGVVAVALPLLGLPANARDLVDWKHDNVLAPLVREKMLLAPRVPFATQLPRSVQPDDLHAPGATVGWLLDGVRSGRVPRPALRPVAVATATLGLSLRRVAPQPNRSDCAHIDGPVSRDLQKGDTILLRRGAASIVYTDPNGVRSRPQQFRGFLGFGNLTLQALAGPLSLEITPSIADNELCG